MTNTMTNQTIKNPDVSVFLLSCTDHLDHTLAQKMKEEILKRDGKVAYISSSPQEEPYPYYQSTIADYKAIDPSIEVDYFDLSDHFSDTSLAKLPNYGSIYLSGGNTFAFMDAARMRNLYPLLKSHTDAGGLLIGASAGALMLTPSIALASDEDENIVGMTDFTGFGFVNFEFYPHWHGLPAQQAFLQTSSRNRTIRLYTSEDGSGIFYHNGIVHTYGNVSEL